MEPEGEEVPMFKTRKNSFKKNMAILACVAFVFASLPAATQAASRHRSPELPFPKESFSLFSPVFSLISLNSPLVAYDLAAVYNLLGKDKKPTPPPPTTDDKNEKDKKKKDPYDDSGNSTSKRRPNGKD